MNKKIKIYKLKIGVKIKDKVHIMEDFGTNPQYKFDKFEYIYIKENIVAEILSNGKVEI